MSAQDKTFRQRDEDEAMSTDEAVQARLEIETLLLDYGAAEFDCGAYLDGEVEAYKKLTAQRDRTKAAVLAQILTLLVRVVELERQLGAALKAHGTEARLSDEADRGDRQGAVPTTER